jgi:hypothetical protein
MPDRPRALKLHGNAMTNRTSWSHCFALFSIFTTFLSVLLLPAFDPAIFEPQTPIGGFSPYANQTSLPESYIAAGDAVIGTYFSTSATEVLQTEDNPLSDGGKISIETEVREVGWLIARYLEQASARTDILLVSLEWYGSPR